MAETLRDALGFTSCRADPDVWFRKATKPDGSDYYEYVIVYTDDILAVSLNPKAILTQIDQHYLLKPNSIGELTTYLGATISKNFLDDDPAKVRWGMGADDYVKEALRNLEIWLEKKGLKLKTKHLSTVLPHKYAPELDVSDYCSEEEASYYMQQMGVLRWAVELGRIDICTEVSMMASFQAAPRKGHLDAVFHIFAFLKKHPKAKLIFDSSRAPHIPVPDKPQWSDFYDATPESLPPGAPPPLGESVQTTTFADSSFASDQVSRRSRTGVMLYVNRSLVNFLSKRQNSIETSTFGAEFCALKVAMEMTIALRCKLQMMGVPLDGPTRMRCDNMSVVANTSNPASQLKKKSNAVAHHFVRECFARGIAFVACEHADSNLADLMTKCLSGTRRLLLCNNAGLW